MSEELRRQRSTTASRPTSAGRAEPGTLLHGRGMGHIEWRAPAIDRRKPGAASAAPFYNPLGTLLLWALTTRTGANDEDSFDRLLCHLSSRDVVRPSRHCRLRAQRFEHR